MCRTRCVTYGTNTVAGHERQKGTDCDQNIIPCLTLYAVEGVQYIIHIAIVYIVYIVYRFSVRFLENFEYAVTSVALYELQLLRPA